MGDTSLKRRTRLGTHALGHLHEPVHRFLVRRAAEGPGDKIADQLARIFFAGLRALGHRLREKLGIIRRLDPELVVERSADRHLAEAQAQQALLVAVGTQRADFEGQAVVAGLPLAVEGEFIDLVLALAHELAVEQRLAIRGKEQAAAVVVELVIDVFLDGAEIQDDLVFAILGHVVHRLHGRRRVIGKIQGVPLDRGRGTLEKRGSGRNGGPGRLGSLLRGRGRRAGIGDQRRRRFHPDRGEFAPGDAIVGHHAGLGRHRAGDHGLRGIEVFLEQHGRDGQDVADVVEAVPVSSAGNSFSVSKLKPTRSRIVLRYSTRFSRRTVTRPGSGLTGSSSNASRLIQVASFSMSVAGSGSSSEGRHDVRPGVLQHPQPELVVPQLGFGLEAVEDDAALAAAIAVAVIAMLSQQRLDIALEGIHGRFGGKGRQGNQESRQNFGVTGHEGTSRDEVL